MSILVELDDWLAIYTLPDGHQCVRSTENWSEWKHIQSDQYSGEFVGQEAVLNKAISMGPSAHDPDWCGLCASQVEEGDDNG